MNISNWAFPCFTINVFLVSLKTSRKSTVCRASKIFFQSPIQSVYIHSCIETKLCFLMLTANNMEKTMRDL